MGEGQRGGRHRAAEANELLSGYTNIHRIEFESLPPHWSCMVTMLLSKADAPGNSITLRCFDVSQLSATQLGGGLSQLLCLQICFIGADGHDRVQFSIEDLERGSIRFKCDRFEFDTEGPGYRTGFPVE